MQRLVCWAHSRVYYLLSNAVRVLVGAQACNRFSLWGYRHDRMTTTTITTTTTTTTITTTIATCTTTIATTIPGILTYY